MNGFRLAKHFMGQAQIYDIWDTFSSLLNTGIKAAPDIYKSIEAKKIADKQADAARANQAAAAATATAATQNAIAAQALNPTILGLPQTVVILGGLGLAAVGITVMLLKK